MGSVHVESLALTRHAISGDSLFSIPSRFDLLRSIRLESIASSCNGPTTAHALLPREPLWS
jgi:hypothetical protein